MFRRNAPVMEPESTTRGQLSPPMIPWTWNRYLPGITGVTLAIAGCAAWSLINFGSLHLGWLYANGVRVTIAPRVVTVPDGKPGDAREAVFVLRNLSNRPVRIVGATTNCTCLLPGDKLPLTVSPGGTTSLHVALDIRKVKGGRIEQALLYLTDHPSAPRLKVRIAARVVDPG